MTELFIGLMSGTSMDAIDAVLVCFDDPQPKLIHSFSEPLTAELRHRLSSLAPPSENELAQMMELDVIMGRAFGEASNASLQKAHISPDAVRAIGSHGQTIRHIPAGEFPSTCQIGDPNIIAEQTGITTVADFRRRDMAAGGQGAPLVPAFHAAMFRSAHQTRVVVNIAGMANISVLPAPPTSGVVGFDTGPGNVLMDRWIERTHGKGWDENGQWAAQGKIDEKLLHSLLQEPYFQLAPPKSTGRELFSEKWHIGIWLWFLAGVTRSRTVKLSNMLLKLLGVTRFSKARGLLELESAGLIRIDRRHGKNPLVTILIPGRGHREG